MHDFVTVSCLPVLLSNTTRMAVPRGIPRSVHVDLHVYVNLKMFR